MSLSADEIDLLENWAKSTVPVSDRAVLDAVAELRAARAENEKLREVATRLLTNDGWRWKVERDAAKAILAAAVGLAEETEATP